MRASVTRRAGAEEVDVLLRKHSDSVGAPIDLASRNTSLWVDSAPSSRRGFADSP